VFSKRKGCQDHPTQITWFLTKESSTESTKKLQAKPPGGLANLSGARNYLQEQGRFFKRRASTRA
jgi:hypothetical protein